MDATYNSRAIALDTTNQYKWSTVDLMVLIALAMYIFLSVSPQPVGNCSQSLSSNTAVYSVETAAV